jgi:hypothetical protein
MKVIGTSISGEEFPIYYACQKLQTKQLRNHVPIEGRDFIQYVVI